jgi:hypothetical protein
LKGRQPLNFKSKIEFSEDFLRIEFPQIEKGDMQIDNHPKCLNYEVCEF